MSDASRCLRDFSAILMTLLLVVACKTLPRLSPGSLSTLTIGNPKGISRPYFAGIGDLRVGKKHTIHLAPGRHDVRVALNWQNGPLEEVSFPIVIPEPGDYFIEVLPHPTRDRFQRVDPSHPSDDLRVTKTDHPADFLQVLIKPIEVAVHGAEQLKQNAEQLSPDWYDGVVYPQSINLRLRTSSMGGEVLSWKRFDNPSLRKESAE